MKNELKIDANLESTIIYDGKMIDYIDQHSRLKNSI